MSHPNDRVVNELKQFLPNFPQNDYVSYAASLGRLNQRTPQAAGQNTCFLLTVTIR